MSRGDWPPTAGAGGLRLETFRRGMCTSGVCAPAWAPPAASWGCQGGARAVAFNCSCIYVYRGDARPPKLPDWLTIIAEFLDRASASDT